MPISPPSPSTPQDPSTLDASARLMYESAQALGISCTIMPDNQTILMKQGVLQWYSRGSRTSTQSAIGQTIVGNKAIAKKFLHAFQIPTAQSVSVTQPSELTRLTALELPLVMKPTKGAHGRGVIVGIQSLAEAEIAFHKLAEPVLFEEMLQGTEYRIVCVDYHFVAAAYRKAAYVIGDGDHTIEELVTLKNLDPNRQIGHKGNLSKIIIDETVLTNLQEQQLTPTSIPAINQEVQLRKTANLSTGGEAHNVTHLVCPENKALFERIAQIFDLSVVGIDIMCQSLETPISMQSNAGVIEINKSPGLRMHHYPSLGEPIDLATSILTATIKHLSGPTP
jgi:cyanophycin synthetase